MRQNEPRHSEQPASDELDGLLHQARWPEPSADSTRRLSASWSRLSHQGSWSVWRPALSVAAAIGALFIIAWMFHTPAVRPMQSIAFHPALTVAAQSEITDGGRSATHVELAMLRVIRKSGSSPAIPGQGVPLMPLVTGWRLPSRGTALSSAAQPSVDASALTRRVIASKDPIKRDLLLDQLVSLPPQTTAAFVLNLLAQPEMASSVIDALARHPQGWSEVLLSALNDPRVPVRSCASLALAKIDGPVITARLIAMANININRREAINALVRMDSTDARKYVKVAQETPELGAIVRSAIAQDVNFATPTGALQ